MLSNEQKKAIEIKNGNVLVAAGAGGSKTTVLTEHLRFLLENGVDADKIYAITYTNIAAQEMADRLKDLSVTVFIGTIHSLANKILKSNNISTTQMIEDKDFYKLLEVAKQKNIVFPVIEHLLVDEFQDIDDDEFEFITSTLQAKNIYTCGDEAQSIFSFKGSNYKNFTTFKNRPKTTTYELKVNYRNGRNIFNYAESFVNNMRDIYRVKGTIINATNPGIVEELAYSLEDIADILNEKKNYGEWFILGRTNAEVDSILCFLQKENIPCVTFKKSQKTYQELQEELTNNSVKVLTIHSAKGLESKNVIVVGLRTFNDEELRVCYVACTRAKERLIIMKVQRSNNKKKKKKYRNPEDGVIDFDSLSPSNLLNKRVLDAFTDHLDEIQVKHDMADHSSEFYYLEEK